jgi:hypothetical protein
MIRVDNFDIKGHRVQFNRDTERWAFNCVTMLEVLPWSSLTMRRAVYQFARYFRMEEGYDFTQYGTDGREDDPTCRAYLFTAPDSYRSGLAFGAACFRTREDDKGNKWEALCWVWIHPFNRRRGVMASALPVFKKQHGEFFPETPWSPAMGSFVAKYMPEVLTRMGRG